MKQLIEQYEQYRRQLKALRYVGNIANWDMQTEAPSKSIAITSEHLAYFSEMDYKIRTSQEFEDIVQQLFDGREHLSSTLAHEIVVVKNDIDNAKKTPMDELLEFQKVTNNCYSIYVKAKLTDDFELFVPTLTKISEFAKKQTKWLAKNDCFGYDVLLDQYEPKFSMSSYDKFFDLLKAKLIPFVKRIANTPLHYNDSFVDKEYPIDKQKEFCQYLLNVIGFDKEAGVVKESEHPFTSGLCSNDVRITIHYFVDNIVSAIFSCIHEGGHAIYEQNVSDELRDTLVDGGASLGMHESQSRFFENIIGKSYAFWQQHFGKLQQLFPTQFESVTAMDFYKHINKATMSFVRVDADELTYPLHIMLRYDMEKEFVDGDLQVKDFPKYWNDKFYQYFGITPPNDALGCLQDVHWAVGSIGYFPTYALGSAIASQLYAKMCQDVNVDKCLEGGSTKEINDWLCKNIHRYGSSMYPMDILRKATGQEFDPNYYVDYLIDKYSKIYNICD